MRMRGCYDDRLQGQTDVCSVHESLLSKTNIKHFVTCAAAVLDVFIT